MPVTKETKVIISADASKYERAMRSMKLTGQKTGQAISSVFKRVGSIMAGMVGKIAAVAGIGGLGLLAKRALETGDIIHKMSIRLGISTEALSELQHVANLSGVSFQTTAKSYQKMSENISDANTGLGTAKDSIADLGLDIAKLHALSPEKQFEAIADALQGITNQSDKIRVAADIFGGRGVEMLQIMEKGADGIREMRDQAERLGITLSQDAANRIAAVNDAMARFTGAVVGASQKIMSDLSPSLVYMVDWFGTRVPAAIQTTIDTINFFKDLFKEATNLSGGGFGRIGSIGSPTMDEFDSPFMNIDKTGGLGGTAGGEIAAGAGGGTTETVDAQSQRDQEQLDRIVAQEEAKFNIALASTSRMEQLMLESGSRISQMEFDRGRLEAENAEKTAKLKAGAVKTTLDNVIKTGKLLLQESGTRNKAIFNITKAASIAQAVMSTYAGAANAMKDVPYPYNFAAAASVIAFGLAQVSNIMSQSFDSGSTTGVSGGGGAGVPAVSPTTAPAVAPVGTNALLAETASAERRGTINVSFKGDIIGDDQFIDNLVEKINEAEDRDVFINLSKFAGELA